MYSSPNFIVKFSAKIHIFFLKNKQSQLKKYKSWHISANSCILYLIGVLPKHILVCGGVVSQVPLPYAPKISLNPSHNLLKFNVPVVDSSIQHLEVVMVLLWTKDVGHVLEVLPNSVLRNSVTVCVATFKCSEHHVT